MRRCSLITLAAIVFVAAANLQANPAAPSERVGIVSHIQRVPVESTALAAVGYSMRLRVLEIEFRNGAIYRYLDVPRAVHKGMMNAPSKARFYHQNIRGKYRALNVRRRGR